ncbi:hypothetical protein H4R34_003363 [Dimargaris verticillata]|uniref:Kinesin-like protein n=1 Tax=Dimargaris verticillata TaxID=2761393 RepID=A0A9W8B6D2_9FUNG|nr:hypothetical protein H4R34_003363 [Dimargaris verticillata]
MTPKAATKRRRSSGKDGPAHRIKVLCRVRPFLKHETPDNSVAMADQTVKIVNQRNPDEVLLYSFDSCYDASASQQSLFQQDVRPLVDNIFQGLDATIFCYGVTGAGKTHTVQGSTQQPGLVPRTVKYLFTNKRMRTKLRYTVHISYYEIYKEAIFDLLVPRESMSPSGLPIREDGNKNIFIPNLTEQEVSSYAQFEQLFHRACKNRSTASTKLNLASSRSHAILTVQISWRDVSRQTTLRGRVHLIDLAGSEDNRRTENGKARMAESGAINKSLFVLGQVVEALNSGAHRIPYRDSKMTRILQQSLGGQSLGMMIVNIAPGQQFYVETYNTLNFATKSKQIVNKAKVHEFHSPNASTSDLPRNAVVGLGKARRKSDREDRMTDPTDRATKRARTADGHQTRPLAHDAHRVPLGRVSANARVSDSKPQRRTLTSSRDTFDAELESRVEKIMEKKVKELHSKGWQPTGTAKAGTSQGPPANAISADPAIQHRLAMLEQRLASQIQHNEGVLDLLSPTTKHKNAKAHVKRGKMLEKEGRVEEALIHFEKATEFVPDRETLYQYIQKMKHKHGIVTDHVPIPVSRANRLGAQPATNALLTKLAAVAKDDLATDPSQPASAQAGLFITSRDSKGPPARKVRRQLKGKALPSQATGPLLDQVAIPSAKSAPPIDFAATQCTSNGGPARLCLNSLTPQSARDSPQPDPASSKPAFSFMAPGASGTGGTLPTTAVLRSEKAVLAIINSGHPKLIMTLKGIGKKRAEQIKEFVNCEGPLEELRELAFIGFKESVIKKLLEDS